MIFKKIETLKQITGYDESTESPRCFSLEAMCISFHYLYSIEYDEQYIIYYGILPYKYDI